MTDEKTELAVSLPVSQVRQVDRIAAAMGVDRASVVERALRQYLGREGADILAEADGIAELENGQGVEFDQVLRKADVIVRRAEALRTAKAG